MTKLELPILMIPNALLAQQYHVHPNIYPHPWEDHTGSRYEDEDYEEPTARFTPEVEQFCVDTFGKAPRITWDDGWDYDRKSLGWIAWFRNTTDLIVFKMAYSEYLVDHSGPLL